MSVSDTTLFAVFSELLVDIGARQTTLRRFAMAFKILYVIITVLIGIFTIVNTVFAFTEQDPLVRKIFQVLNMIVASGLLGNFGKKQQEAKIQVSNMQHVVKSLLTSMGKLGLGVVPQPSIIDTNFLTGPVLPMPVLIPRASPASNDLSDLISSSDLKCRLAALQVLVDSR